MKRITRYSAMAAFGVLIALNLGCKKFLTVKPVGQTTIPTLFSDMDGIRAAVPGAYSKVYDYYSNHFYLYPELAGDLIQLDVQRGGDGQVNVYNFANVPEQEAAPSAKIWSDIFEALANVNNALFYLPQLEAKYPKQVDELRMYRAEMLALRALAHFDLCRAYAQPYTYTNGATHLGVPVLRQTPGPDDVVKRGSVQQVYDLIVSDLEEAEKIYSTNTFVRAVNQKPYFINQEAVWGLLSRVYLYMEKWDKSVQYADLVLDARPQLPTNNNYLNQYFQLSGYEAETLFRLNGMDKGSSLYSYFNYRQLTGSQVPAVQISQNLLSEYTSSNQSDLRSSGLIAVFGNVNSPSYVTKKFDVIHPDGTENNKFHVNPIVIRVAEVYLNRAEAYVALNQPEKAAADVKKILARALMVSENTIDLPSNNVNAMRELVYKERMKELAFEGHRLFDITRRKQDLVRSTSSTSSVKILTYPNDRFVLPIPQRELDANRNMEPNPTVNN